MENVMKSSKRLKSKADGKQSQSAKSKAAEKAPRSREDSKQQIVLNQLQGSEGTTIAAIMKTTGWQPHSVYGFLSGVVRKKLGLTLISKKTDIGRIYRIAPASGASSRSRGHRRAS
jgi:hypothetical protein